MNPQTPAAQRRQLAMLVLGAIGLATSLYLIALHERLAAGDHSPSVCAITSDVDCAPALLSRYASLGGVPIAAYGAWFYVFVSVVVGLGWLDGRRRSLVAPPGPRPLIMLGAAAAASLLSIALGLVSIFVVNALCPLCTLLYLVNFTLLVLAWLDVTRRPGGFATAWARSRTTVTRRPAQALTLGAVILGTLLALPLAYGFASPASALCQAIRRAEDSLSMTVYADFQCPFCKELDQQLRRARQKVAFEIVPRNFPLDKECNPGIARTHHPGACLQAQAAICARPEEQFDAFTEQLFARRPTDEAALIDLAASLGIDRDGFRTCLAAPGTRAQLADEIRSAHEQHVRATPTLILDGLRYVGTLTAPDLRCLETAGS